VTIVAKRKLSRRVYGALCSLWLVLAVAMPVAAGEDGNFFTHLHTDKAMANVTVSPAHAGPVDITIQLETVDERPLQASAVSVTLSSAKAGVKAQTIRATKTNESEWHVKTSLPVRGRWTLGLGILISDTDRIDVAAPILVK
jgi:copper transport protein